MNLQDLLAGRHDAADVVTTSVVDDAAAAG